MAVTCKSYPEVCNLASFWKLKKLDPPLDSSSFYTVILCGLVYVYFATLIYLINVLCVSVQHARMAVACTLFLEFSFVLSFVFLESILLGVLGYSLKFPVKLNVFNVCKCVYVCTRARTRVCVCVCV